MKRIIILSTLICIAATGCQDIQSTDTIKSTFSFNNRKIENINRQIKIATEAIELFPDEQQLEAIDSKSYEYLKLIAKAKLNRYRLQKSYAISSEIEEQNEKITQLKAKLELVQSPLTSTIEKLQGISDFIDNNLQDYTDKEPLLTQYNQLKAKADIAEQRLNKFYRRTDYAEIKKSQAKIEAAEFDYRRKVNEIKIEAANNVINGSMGTMVADIWSQQQIIVAQKERIAKYNESIQEQKDFFKYKLAPRMKASLEAVLESDDISSVSYQEILMAQVEMSEMGNGSIDPLE